MLRKILTYPNPLLAKKSVKVEEIDDNIKRIATDMLDTLNHVGGVGIAAPQIGENVRMIIIDKSLAIEPKEEGEEIPQDFQLIINPEVTVLDPKKKVQNEGCLSVLDLRSDVARPCHVKVSGVDIDNKPVEVEGKEYLSACIQHEYDHLEGITFLNHLSFLKRQLYNKKVNKV